MIGNCTADFCDAKDVGTCALGHKRATQAQLETAKIACLKGLSGDTTSLSFSPSFLLDFTSSLRLTAVNGSDITSRSSM
jgi:hypothetical protein